MARDYDCEPVMGVGYVVAVSQSVNGDVEVVPSGVEVDLGRVDRRMDRTYPQNWGKSR